MLSFLTIFGVIVLILAIIGNLSFMIYLASKLADINTKVEEMEPKVNGRTYCICRMSEIIDGLKEDIESLRKQ